MAVVRVKRHFQDEPIDTLLLACKRRKTEDAHLTSIFKFTATVSDQKESVYKNISKVIQSPDFKKSFKVPNITEKLRAENKLFSQNNRLKVVNCFRTLNDLDYLEQSGEPSSSDHTLTIVEIESQPKVIPETATTLADEDSEDSSKNYVYDIYYAPDCKLDEEMLGNVLSCHSVDDLMLEDCRDDVFVNDEDSDDSNDENNWRNDYPDEDPDSTNEDNMKLACQFGGLNLSETNSLSSDNEDENLVYGMDDPYLNPDGFNGEYYEHEMDYSAYKKRLIKELESDASEDSDDLDYYASDVESD